MGDELSTGIPNWRIATQVVYPKFKNGETTVRSVRIQQNFGKWQNCLKCIVCVCSQTSMLEVKSEINVIVTYYL